MSFVILADFIMWKPYDNNNTLSRYAILLLASCLCGVLYKLKLYTLLFL